MGDGRDQRPAGAKLEYLGLAESHGDVLCRFSDASAPRLAGTGIDLDGWMAQSATLLLPPSNHSMDLTIQTEYPTWAPAAGASLRAKVDSVSGEITLMPGQTATLHLHLPASATLRTLHLHAPAELQMPAPDARRRSLRILEAQLMTSTDA